MIRVTILPILIFVLSGFCLCQELPPAPKKPERRVGHATVYYFENSDVTHALVQSYVLGDIDGDYKAKDSVIINADYNVKGKMPLRPPYVDFWIQFSSVAENKYVKNHRLTIFADDEDILTVEPEALYARPEGWGRNVETYSVPKLEYAIFHRLCSAKKAAIRVGDSKFGLPEIVLQALRDLDSTVDK